MQYQEKELFQSYEIKNWIFSPRLYKIFGAAAVFNLLSLFIIGNANVFTTRGCDSPLVGNFCQVLDTIYLGSTLLDANGEFVSKDYQKTQLEDADITFVDVSGATPPLTYPAGYFALANPESAMTQMPDMNGNFPMIPPPNMNGFPGIPTNPTVMNGNDFLSKPQVTPTPNKNVIAGNLDDSPFTIEGTVSGNNPVPAPKMTNRPPINRRPFGKVKGRNALPKPPIPDSETTAEKKPDENQPPLTTDAVAEVEINKKPFEDLGDFVNEELEKKQIDLNKSFKVVMEGTITDDGKLDAKKSKFVKVEGDEKMKEVARQAIEAVGNSGFLVYLKKSGVDKVNFTLVQDDKQINVIIVSEQKTPEKAGTTASSFNTLLSGLKFADANGLKKLDENSKTLIENSKITSDGKNFVLNFALPKQTAQDIITKTLKDRAEKRAVQQPKSSAETNSNSKTALVK